jgi:DNA helicase-2/ATP-dependent DNA helicase PcrA
MADPLLDDLDDEQRAAVTCETTPLAIHAPAGSGKTRVLTRRIAWRAREGLHDPDRVLAVTFTRKAAGELTARLRRLGVPGAVTAGTIHAIALAQLRRRALDHGRTPPELLERKVRLLAPIVGGRGPAAGLAAQELAGEIEWAKTRLVRPEAYAAEAAAADRHPGRPLDQIADDYARYEEVKRRRRLADFEDLVWWCGDALDRDREFAAAQHWRFRHLFVDEFQDTSPAQLRLIRSWLGDRDDLCVVGDPDQAIFAFAGAQAGYLARFERTFPGGRVVHLRTNYRCTPEIVAAAEALLADGGGRRPPVRAAAEPGARPTCTEYDDEEAEARGVADRLRAAHAAGVPWREMAVLSRTNAQSGVLEPALTRAGVPFRLRGSARFLDRPEVQLALADLRRAADRSPEAPFGALLDTLVGETVDEERREHLDVLVRFGHDYLRDEGPHASVGGFVAHLTTAMRDGADGAADTQDAVELCTFHRAKGLEFHTVCITGLERGLVPISHAEQPADRAEERRLLYVALTRAGRTLHLTRARSRTVGARAVRRAPSPWLEVVLAAGGPPPPAPASAADIRARRNRLAATGDPAGPAPGDQALFEALKEWRRRVALAGAVPAYVVCADATLREIAARRPRTRDDLLEVHGIGPVKVERFGDDILAVVAEAPGRAPAGGRTG